MRIHHLNCGSMCPYGGRHVSGAPGKAEIVCHCVLIETAESLVLVDTGMGVDDVHHPFRRLGRPFSAAFRPGGRLEETAFEQVRALGHDPRDVRRIIVTHLDLDHAGGLPDFPWAEVHVFAPEQAAALRPKLRERSRYPRCHLTHGPRWQPHTVDGDSWNGFEAIRVLPGIEPEILMVPLPGHSRGHTAVALRENGRWTLHCGDAYYHRGEIADPVQTPRAIGLFEAAMAADNAARRENLERLRELAKSRGDELQIFCAHDPVELERARAAAA